MQLRHNAQPIIDSSRVERIIDSARVERMGAGNQAIRVTLSRHTRCPVVLARLIEGPYRDVPNVMLLEDAEGPICQFLLTPEQRETMEQLEAEAARRQA